MIINTDTGKRVCYIGFHFLRLIDGEVRVVLPNMKVIKDKEKDGD